MAKWVGNVGWKQLMEPVRILLADDHAVVRAGIRNALEGLPDIVIVGEVGNGPQVQQALSDLHPDCLLIDVTMPEFEPIGAIRAIRARYPRLRILVVSAYDDDVYVQGLLGIGVDGYHLKDQPLSDLRLAVQRVIAGERWISSPLLSKLLNPATSLAALPSLSPRQKELLRLLAHGADNRTIASQLDLSVKTVENHLTRLYRQLDVQSRLEAAHYAREHPELIAHAGGGTAVHVDPSYWADGAEQGSILIVDDNKRYRYQLRRTIGKAYPQATIYEAENVNEMVQIIQRVRPKIAFVDVVLGDEDGISCVRKLKAAVPATRIILISAYPDREFHRRGLEAGATAFVDKKDLDAAALTQIIRDAIA